MYPSAAHALDAFLAASHAADERLWGRRLAVLRAILAFSPELSTERAEEILGRLAPPPTVAEVLEVARLAREARMGTGEFQRSEIE
jgi:hypothetical protein